MAEDRASTVHGAVPLRTPLSSTCCIRSWYWRMEVGPEGEAAKAYANPAGGAIFFD